MRTRCSRCALYPSADAVGSDSDNIGGESDQATEETPAVAIITMALFSMNARRERLMDLSLNLAEIQCRLKSSREAYRLLGLAIGNLFDRRQCRMNHVN